LTGGKSRGRKATGRKKRTGTGALQRRKPTGHNEKVKTPFLRERESGFYRAKALQKTKKRKEIFSGKEFFRGD
jgi:hypothetical protein